MNKLKLTTYVVPVCCLMNMICFGQASKAQEGKVYPDPNRFEKAIQVFEANDQEQRPAQNAIVCIGSSSMRGWHSMIKEDLAPLTLIARGFGGSNMNEALYFADRIVLPYKPRAIMVYEGDNDVAQGITPKKITHTFRMFTEKVHKALPECRIYFLAIKPSISRWALWPTMQEANRLVKRACKKDKRLTFLDIASCMLAGNGTPKPHIFKDDNLHMNREGYILWRDAVRPILVKKELQYE